MISAVIASFKQCLKALYPIGVDVESKPWPRKDAPPLVMDLDDI